MSHMCCKVCSTLEVTRYIVYSPSIALWPPEDYVGCNSKNYCEICLDDLLVHEHSSLFSMSKGTKGDLFVAMGRDWRVWRRSCMALEDWAVAHRLWRTATSCGVKLAAPWTNFCFFDLLLYVFCEALSATPPTGATEAWALRSANATLLCSAAVGGCLHRKVLEAASL